MDKFKDETEFTHLHMRRVVDMFDGPPSFQQIVRFVNMGYGINQDDLDEDPYEYDDWVHGHNISHGYPRLSDRNSDRGLGRSHARSSGSLHHTPLRYYPSSRVLSPSVNAQTKESSAERTAKLLEEAKKIKGKAERKRLKKQKQKERKRLEKQEKEKQNPVKNEEEGDDAHQSKAEESKPVNESENNTSSSVKLSASAKDTDSSDSSEDESSEEDDAKNDSCDSEELDMTSTFVTKAALIAKRQLQQKPEGKEKKKTPDKEKRKVLDKPKEDLEAGKKDSAVASSLTFEDNIKISTDLANTGNKFASEGDFNMAVKYFTDAIRYNPTEFKLFGNRSFCFEKMQEYTKALADAEVSLSMCPGWVKGLFRKGRALAGLKRYQEAAQAFREVLRVDSSCAEAAQELMRVQITQLMGYGYTREQSSNALIIHGTVKKALEVLSDLNRPGAVQNGTLSPPQVANISGVSPVLSANTGPATPRPPPPHHHHSHNAPKPPPLKNKPLGPVQNMSNVQSRPKPPPDHALKTKYEDSRPSHELFPVWVGNLIYPVNETTITNLFNKVGPVYSVKVLSMKRCAFVNFTKQEHCDEAIRRFHGYELSGVKLAVRYPDRIPPGMGISKSALKADDLHDENMRQNGTSDWAEASGSRGPARPYKQGPGFRGSDRN